MDFGKVLLIGIIVVVLIFIIWFLPKALKDWSVAWGKGFTRVYYALALIITFFFAMATAFETKDSGWGSLVVMWIVYYLIAVMAFKSFTWVFGAFIKKKK